MPDEQAVVGTTEIQEVQDAKEELRSEAEAQVSEEVKQEQTETQVSESEKKPDGEEYSRKVKARIDKLYHEKMLERTRADKAEARLRELEKLTDERPSRPNMAQYADEYGNVDHDRYNRDVALYEDRYFQWREDQKNKSESEIRKKTEEEVKFEAFQIASETARAKYADYDQMIGKNVFGDELRNALLEEQMAEVAYYLGKNESEAKRISQMPVNQMMRELGRIEEKITLMAKQPSKAPAPINPVSDDKGIAMVDESKLTDEQIIKKWEMERRAKIEKQWSK